MRFDSDGNPRPDPPEPREKRIAQWLIVAAGIAAGLVGASAIQASLTAPLPEIATPSAPSSTVEPAPTYPPVILEMAAAIATVYAPTPTSTPRPIDTYTPVATLALPICAEALPDGTLCEWPMPVITPTEVPTCQTPEPLMECVWRATATERSASGRATPALDPILGSTGAANVYRESRSGARALVRAGWATHHAPLAES